MPNRIIKESVCTSDTVEQMTWFEECFWHRLIVNCDDYGRMDARPAVLKSRLFPLKERMTLKDVSGALTRLADIGCVVLYECDGHPYLYLPTWEVHQTIRAKKSKYPEPISNMQASEIICKQMQADVPVIQSNPNPNPKGNESPLPPLDEFSEPMQEAIRNWLSYKEERREKYKPTGLTQFISMTRNAVSKYGEDAVLYAFTHSMGANYQGIVWEKAQKFKAEPPDNYYERLN